MRNWVARYRLSSILAQALRQHLLTSLYLISPFGRSYGLDRSWCATLPKLFPEQCIEFIEQFSVVLCKILRNARVLVDWSDLGRTSFC